MNKTRRPHLWNPTVTLAMTLAIVAGCCHPRPLGYVPREGKFETPLLASMAKASSNDLIHVVLMFTNQVSEADKRSLFLAIKAGKPIDTFRQQRQALIEKLKLSARQTQTPVLEQLRALERKGVVKDVRPLWIANAIAAQVPPTVISNLATNTWVTSLHWDPPRLGMEQADGRRGRGLDEVRLPEAPGSPFQSDVVVAVIDSGVDWSHPDLTPRRHTHGAEIPGDNTGHGTFAAGIVAGDGTGGVRTGVAPQARIMALRPTGWDDLSTEQACLEAVQYAVENGAHIINFSNGWKDAENPNFAAWRETVQSAMDAGVLFVTVAGNNGSSLIDQPPFQVKTPGRVPAALTVGWGSGGYSVSGKSGKGPVTWAGIEPFFDYPHSPGLTKPDLVAPGENVESTKLGGGYSLDSGSSWAAPHVAGVAALLLGQNPELKPYELRYILEESASWGEGHARPDAVSGWGHLNAEAALAHPMALALDLIPFDLFVTNLHVKPPPASDQAPLLSATLTNLGGQVVGNAEMRFYVAHAAQCTVKDLDPDGDGIPEEGVFKHVGSYFVPVLGPGPSGHGGFEGVVRWTNAVPSAAQWLGVWVLPGATIRDPEASPHNNGAVLRLSAGGL